VSLLYCVSSVLFCFVSAFVLFYCSRWRSCFSNSRKVVLVVVADNHGKRGLEFDWHQVSRKSWVVGQGSGKNHGHDQCTDFSFEETSSTDSRNRT
jgi:hypothetical protein